MVSVSRCCGLVGVLVRGPFCQVDVRKPPRFLFSAFAFLALCYFGGFPTGVDMLQVSGSKALQALIIDL